MKCCQLKLQLCSPSKILRVKFPDMIDPLIFWACIPECVNCWKVIFLVLSYLSPEPAVNKTTLTKTSVYFSYLESLGSSTKKTTRGWMLNNHYFAGTYWEILSDQTLSILCSTMRKICLIDHLPFCIPLKSS